jgi:ABC-type multidrug transport system fused ATPase/permease subunit
LADPTKQGFFTQGISLFRMLHVRRRRVVLLIMLAVLLAMLEGIGVGLLNPVLQYVQYGTVKTSGFFGTILLDLIDALGLPVDLLTLLIFAFIPVLLRQVVFFVYFWATARVQQAAATRMRADGFAALVNSDLPFIFGEGFGNLVSTLTAQAQRGSQALFGFLQQIATGLVIVMYVAVSSTRTPPFEVWGLAIKVLQVALLAVLLYLSIRPPSHAAPRRVDGGTGGVG